MSKCARVGGRRLETIAFALQFATDTILKIQTLCEEAQEEDSSS
jgi:hypothetical protein